MTTMTIIITLVNICNRHTSTDDDNDDLPEHAPNFVAYPDRHRLQLAVVPFSTMHK
jgi:hypothetical protein